MWRRDEAWVTGKVAVGEEARDNTSLDTPTAFCSGNRIVWLYTMYGQQQLAYAPTPYSYTPSSNLTATINLDEVVLPEASSANAC